MSETNAPPTPPATEPQVTPPPVITEEAPREFTQEDLHAAAIKHVIDNNLLDRLPGREPTPPPAPQQLAYQQPQTAINPRYIAGTTIQEPMGWDEMTEDARTVYVAQRAMAGTLGPIHETLERMAESNGKRLLGEDESLKGAVRKLFGQATPGQEWKYVSEDNIEHIRIYAAGISAQSKGPSFGELHKPSPTGGLPADYAKYEKNWNDAGYGVKHPFSMEIYKDLKAGEMQ